MFSRLSEGFSSALRRLSGQATLSEANIADALADVRRALLEADVALEVVDRFCAAVKSAAVGRDVTKSLKPDQEFIGVVYEQLVALLGDMPIIPDGASQEEATKILAADGPGILHVAPGPTIVMLCGLQGSGKTTTAAKLAGWLKKRGRSVMLVAADLQRPAAVEQLQTVADAANRDLPGGASVSCYAEPDKSAEYGKAVGVAVAVCQRGLAAARAKGVDTVILDTAGRLHVNDELMGELHSVKAALRPHQVFLVVDAMTGQDAVRSAKAFNEKLAVDALVLTKFDSDTRGGAALSVKSITGAPIRFVGTGEKLDALEEFIPQRFAGRILGMGDVLSLVQRAREQVSDEEAAKLEAKMAKGEMTLDDFLAQMKSLRRMGPLKQLLGLLPGVGSMLQNVNIDDKHLDRLEGMINSMTKKERVKPSIIDHSRRRRIAKGSAHKPEDVSQLVKQFETVSKLSKSFATMNAADKVKAVKGLSAAGDSGPLGAFPGMGGMPNLAAKGSSFSPSIKSRFKKRK